MARRNPSQPSGDLFRCTVFFALKERAAPIALTLRVKDQLAAAAAAHRRARVQRAGGKLRRLIVEAVS